MKRVLLFALFTLLFASSVGWAATFGVRDVGIGSAAGVDINNSNQMLLNGTQGGIVVNSNGTVARTISTMEPFAYIVAQRMNDGGDVVGFEASPNYLDGSYFYGQYRWRPDGTSTGGGSIYTSYSVYGINNSGAYVGQQQYYRTGISLSGWVTDWDGTNRATQIASGCYGINNNGVVAGYTADYVNGHITGNIQAHLYASNGGVTDLGPGIAQAVNDAGIVAGRTQDGSLCYWTTGLVRHDVGLLSGCTYAWVTDINSSGAFVGYCGEDTGTIKKAFYWSSTTGLVSLPGLNPGDNTQANGINDAGLVIGSSWVSSGNGRAVIWSIPEPSSMLALLPLLGGLAVLRRRR